MRIFFLIQFFLLYVCLETFAQLNWGEIKMNDGYSENDYGVMAVESDGKKNIYMTGYFNYSATFQGNLLQSDRSDMFLTKTDSTGQVKWAKSLGHTSYNYALDLVVDNMDNLYLLGYKDYVDSTLVIKFGTDGTIVWEKKYYGTSFQNHRMLFIGDQLFFVTNKGYWLLNTSDGSSNTWVSGLFYRAGLTSDNRLWLTSNSTISVGNLDVNGAFVQDFSVNLNRADLVKKVIVDSALYVAGEYTGTYSPDGTPENTFNNPIISTSIYMAKFDLQGNLLWSNAIETGQSYATDMVRRDEGIYLTGKCSMDAVFNGIHSNTGFSISKAFVSIVDEQTGKFTDVVFGGGITEENTGVEFIDRGTDGLILVGHVYIHEIEPTYFGDKLFKAHIGKTYFIADILNDGKRLEFRGQVFYNTQPVSAELHLYEILPGGGSVIKAITSNGTDGNFILRTYSKGNYVIRAVNRLNENINTYYPSDFMWNTGTQFNLNSDTTIVDLKIDMLNNPQTVGASSLSGNIVDNSDVPKRFIDVFLTTTKNELFSYTRTDTLGNYLFNQIPDGTYRVFVDTTGISADLFHEVVVFTSGRMEGTLNGYDFIIKDGKVFLRNQNITAIDEQDLNGLKFYPNPTDGHLFIEAILSKGTLLYVLDITGRLIMERTLYENHVDLSELPEGVYILKLSNPGQPLKSQKIIILR
ncbi:MAG: T9SS type A sorting domain-containing protein [Cyclobacteriaceae bacterium]|nr:T9SS type A sorting domain-containing protein [Cyclobacteriaceae bacterium]